MVIEAGANLLESIVWVLFQTWFHGSIRQGWRKTVGIAVTIVLLTANIWLADKVALYSPYTFWIDFIILLLYSILCLAGVWYSKIFTIMLFNICIFTCNFFCLALFENCFHIPIAEMVLPGAQWRLPYLFAIKSMLIIVSAGILWIRRSAEDRTGYTGLLFVLPALTIYIISILMELFEEYYRLGGNMTDIVLLVVAVSILLAISMYLLWRTLKEKKQKMENLMLQQQLQAQEQSYLQLHKYLKETRKIQHDMKHRLVVAEQLLNKGDIQNGEQYLRQFLEELNGVSQIAVGESVWKTVLEIKQKKAETSGILFQTEVKVQALKGVDDLDLCVLLGNLLDNAIEAEELLGRRKEIHLLLREEFGIYFIQIENRIIESVLQNNSMLRSTKRKQEMHGLGMACIQEIVRKYDGSLKMNERKGWFQTEIWLWTNTKMTKKDEK